MTPDTRVLIDEMVDHLMQLAIRERVLAQTLRTADDTARTELAFYLADAINSHPVIPPGASTCLHSVESYIAYQTRIANWRINAAALDDEWDAIGERVNLLDDPDVDDPDLD